MREEGRPGIQAKVDVRFFAPPPDLAPCFTTFYRLRLTLPPGQRVIDYLQPEWANLRFFSRNAPTTWLTDGEDSIDVRFTATGPSSLPIKFAMGATYMWGVGLLPLGWARYVGVPAHTMANTISDGEKCETFARFRPLLDLLDERSGDDEELFARAVRFFRELAPPPRDENRILAIHEAMIDTSILHVSDFADRACMTTRTLERMCRRHFGFSPRLLLRRQRMMRSLAAFMLGGGKSWSETIDAHYHDQAHFVHEFHAFMGMSPSDYAALPHPILSAFMAERQRVWGSPVQTLDAPRREDDEASRMA